MIYTKEPRLGAATGPLGPSRYWYLVSGCLLVAAAACLTIAVIGMFSWDRQILDFQRVPVPGQGAVTLTQPGGYVLYIETRGGCCAWSVSGQNGPLAWAGVAGRLSRCRGLSEPLVLRAGPLNPGLIRF